MFNLKQILTQSEQTNPTLLSIYEKWLSYLPVLGHPKIGFKKSWVNFDTTEKVTTMTFFALKPVACELCNHMTCAF